MNLKKLSDRELLDLINSTSDQKILDKAESEYLKRMDTETENLLMSGFDELSDYEECMISKYWRPS